MENPPQYINEYKLKNILKIFFIRYLYPIIYKNIWKYDIIILNIAF